jgi:hypothetical protein
VAAGPVASDLCFHIWALVLPQIIEGVITILVLYRAVRIVSTPLAGLVAAVVLAASPITVLKRARCQATSRPGSLTALLMREVSHINRSQNVSPQPEPHTAHYA